MGSIGGGITRSNVMPVTATLGRAQGYFQQFSIEPEAHHLRRPKKSVIPTPCVVSMLPAIRWRLPGETAMESLIVTLVIGAIAGWLATKVLKSTAFGLIGDIIVGVIGGYIGTWLWDVLRLPPVGGFWISAIVTSTVGAIVLLVLLRLIRR